MSRFVDRVVLHLAAGDGGHGCVSVHREKFKPLGGPDGGNGGHGGDIVLEVSPQAHTLMDFHFRPHIRAGRGGNGAGSHRNGARGEDLILEVPVGTVVMSEKGDVLADLTVPGTRFIAAQGGFGGLGNAALRRAAGYAAERVVFDRPIGKNQAIQHPLAKCWAELEAAWLMVMSAAWKYDNGLPVGTAANAAKYLAGEAGYNACQTAVMTHGGFGYAKEFHVERYLRESLIPRIAPVSRELALSFIAEKELGLPKSY